MPFDSPELPELLVSIREHLQQLAPKLDGSDRYETLVSIYLLDIATRELDHLQLTAVADEALLRGLLSADSKVADGDLCRYLAAELRQGKHDQDLDTLLQPLLQHVRDKVAVSRPEMLERDEDSSR